MVGRSGDSKQIFFHGWPEVKSGRSVILGKPPGDSLPLHSIYPFHIT